MDQHEAEKCNFGEDGVCAFHGVEVERRQNARIWQSGIAGWAVLVTMFVAGAYIYAREIKDDMRTQYAANVSATSADIKILSKQVDSLAQGQARTDERYASLLRAITEMNANISTLTYLQFKGRDEISDEPRKVKK